MTSHVLCDYYPVREREREIILKRILIAYNTGLYCIILSHWSDTSLIIIRVYKRIAHNKNNIVCKTIIDHVFLMTGMIHAHHKTVQLSSITS